MRGLFEKFLQSANIFSGVGCVGLEVSEFTVFLHQIDVTLIIDYII